MAVLEDPHQGTVRRGDREKIHHDRLEWQQYGVEEKEQHHDGHQHDEPDREWSALHCQVDKVEIERRLAGHQ